MPAPEPPRRARRLPVWPLVVIIGAACLLNFAWLSYDTTPPQYAAGHLLSALKYRKLLTSLVHGRVGAEGGFVNLLGRLVHVDHRAYPPLFPLTASLVSPTISLRSLVMTNSLFLAVLVLSVYQMGQRLHSRLAGFVSAALILAYPISLSLSRQFMIDYALLALTALSGYLLLASDGFRSPRETYLFGISVGLGMLTKPVFASFMVAPMLFTLARAMRAGRSSEPRDFEPWRVSASRSWSAGYSPRSGTSRTSAACARRS